MLFGFDDAVPAGFAHEVVEAVQPSGLWSSKPPCLGDEGHSKTVIRKLLTGMLR